MPPKAHPAHIVHPARPAAHSAHPTPRKRVPEKPKKGRPAPGPEGTPPGEFEAVYHADGISGFDPSGIGAHIVPFDGLSTGKIDHLFCYISGKGECHVFRNVQGKFTPIYSAKKGGIAGWDFSQYLDRAIAYDYDHSGKMDHILVWRNATGMVWILKHDGQGNFAPVYQSNGGGIGGFDFSYPWDRIMCFDYDKSGKCDALVAYRRWNSSFCVIKNFNGVFVPVYRDWCWGIGGYITSREGDYVFAYDWEHTGYLDHLLFIVNTYQKTPQCGVVARQGNFFVTVWSSAHPIGGFPKTPVKMAIGFPFDYDSAGRLNYFGMIYLNHGMCWIMVSPESNGEWEKVYAQETHGIGTCNLNAHSAPSKTENLEVNKRAYVFEINDRAIPFDYDSSGCRDHLLIYRRTNGMVWILKRKGHQPTPRDPLDGIQPYAIDWYSQGNVPLYAPPSDPGFTPVFQSAAGAAGFELSGAHDGCFAFDFDHSGKTDHLCLYSPGSGAFVIARNDGQNQFAPVYSQSGVGGYSFNSPADLAFAFDFEHSGRLDHICAYRPGTGILWIMSNNQGAFTPVFHDGDPRNNSPGTGVGGFTGPTAADRAFAFDYTHAGRLDHLCLYRPGRGVFWILQNNQGTFTPVYQSNTGIAGYDLNGANDKAFAYDYDHSGCLDYIVLYRPSKQMLGVARNQSGKFNLVYYHARPAGKDAWEDYQTPIGGYDLENAADLAFAFDYHSSGKQDHIVLYRPGHAMAFVVQQLSGGFFPVYQGYGKGGPEKAKLAKTTDFTLYKPNGIGLGGYELSGAADRCIALDFASTGRNDHIVIYRPGSKAIWVVKRTEAPYPVVPPQAPAASSW